MLGALVKTCREQEFIKIYNSIARTAKRNARANELKSNANAYSEEKSRLQAFYDEKVDELCQQKNELDRSFEASKAQLVCAYSAPDQSEMRKDEGHRVANRNRDAPRLAGSSAAAVAAKAEVAGELEELRSQNEQQKGEIARLQRDLDAAAVERGKMDAALKAYTKQRDAEVTGVLQKLGFFFHPDRDRVNDFVAMINEERASNPIEPPTPLKPTDEPPKHKKQKRGPP
mmetsp:Transcript_4495/g.14942  ORF Transcript_4495/g.14942 Transcript_4495/m.14942 type:complete len:229 (+) Transcript_4495:268-954(+)